MMARMDLVFVLVLVLVAGLTIPAVRSGLAQIWTDFPQHRLGDLGARASAEVVEVTLVSEGMDSGERRFGPLNVVSRRDHHGRPRAAVLPRYRILLRFHAPGHGLVAADLERELSTRELDVLSPEARVQIRYDPAHPDRVALDPASFTPPT
jgi:hypothetical protein